MHSTVNIFFAGEKGTHGSIDLGRHSYEDLLIYSVLASTFLSSAVLGSHTSIFNLHKDGWITIHLEDCSALNLGHGELLQHLKKIIFETHIKDISKFLVVQLSAVTIYINIFHVCSDLTSETIEKSSSVPCLLDRQDRLCNPVLQSVLPR